MDKFEFNPKSPVDWVSLIVVAFCIGAALTLATVVLIKLGSLLWSL